MALTSIIIRTKNEGKWLGAVFNAISRQSWKEREVIIVDSGSIDNTLTIAHANGARIYEIPPDSFTYGGSLNRGVREAKGEFIVALSGHAVPATEYWLETLVSSLKDPKVGAVYGRCIPFPDCNPFEAESILRYFGTDRMVQRYNFRFSNANGAWRKEVWARHPFDDKLPATEDQAWGKAILGLGFIIIYEPRAIVSHSHNRTPRQVFLTTRAETAAMKWLLGSQEHWSMTRMLLQWVRSTTRGWLTVWQLRGHWRWWLYCPVYFVAQKYGFYRGFRDPLYTVYPHANSHSYSSVST